MFSYKQTINIIEVFHFIPPVYVFHLCSLVALKLFTAAFPSWIFILLPIDLKKFDYSSLKEPQFFVGNSTFSFRATLV